MKYFSLAYLFPFYYYIYFISCDINAQIISNVFIANNEATLSASIQVSDLTFGNCLPGNTLQKSIIIKNTGTSELVINGFTQRFSKGIFTFKDWNGIDSISIPPNNDTTLTMLFTPSFTMLYYDTIIFHSNATAGDSVSFLLGRGIIYISVEEETIENELFVFPNPIRQSRYISLILPKRLVGYCEIMIYDIHGILIHEEIQQTNSQESLLLNSTRFLPSGHYLCRLRCGNKFFSTTFNICE